MSAGPEPPENQDLLEELKSRLKAAHRLAGKPSYRSIARATKLQPRPLSPATVSRLFNATSPPKWGNLASLITALGVTPQDAETIWHPLWTKLLDTVDPITDPTNTALEALHPGSPASTNPTPCPRCGASVADKEIHDKWHEQLGKVERLIEALERRSPIRTGDRASPSPRRTPPSSP
jgi:hypothetical protein